MAQAVCLAHSLSHHLSNIKVLPRQTIHKKLECRASIYTNA